MSIADGAPPSGLDEFYGPNAGYVAELLERYRDDPESLEPALRASLGGAEAAAPDGAAPIEPPPTVPTPAAPAAASAAALAQAIRFFGHLAARLDPLGRPPPGDPQLDLAAHGLTEEELARLPAGAVGGPVARRASSAAEAIALLRRIYCATSGFELAHVTDPAERSWLIEAVEEERFRPPRDPVDERGLLDRLTELSAFERFLHRAYPGQTRFSIEGLGMMIPMLDELVDRAAETGAKTILLGMAHRGRLNVLAHVLGKPYRQILAEFEGRESARRVAPADAAHEGWTGDVKYHAGARREVPEAGGTVSVVMVPNPSHLEAVNPVVEGMARAADEDRGGPGRPRQEEASSLAVLIHGDAAFPGQGVVAETLNLSRLPGYRTGGTIHLIANNQLGFTTRPTDSRSTLYAGDLAKGFEIPVVHVNADDPVACLAAMRLAVAYRARFGKDVLIDLIGYRRWGHNEGDEPSFTQPMLYGLVRQHPTVRESFAADLVERGVVGPDEPDALLKAGLDEFQRIRESVLSRANGSAGATNSDGRLVGAQGLAPMSEDGGSVEDQGARPCAPTGVSIEELRAINAALTTFPDGFALNRKLERQVERRRTATDGDERVIDWGQAETLAFATILRDGTPVRLTGQDSARGTFSQRHLTFEDERTGKSYTPLEALPGMRASFDVWNSPLSENAVLGFEYGYSIQAPEALVLWEAQYGDFVNGAQAVIDEFVVSGEAKWGLRSGMVMLLPHAWEGQGPDHSGARLERFLQMAAEDNVRIANCSTAAQYFHLLRRQAVLLRSDPRPLIVMTPKSLLRHPLALARPSELADGSFCPVLDDARANPERVERLVLCSGKVWADVEGHARRGEAERLALVRLEELYPFPCDELRAILERHAGAREAIWLQEEPRNAGPWWYVAPRLRELLGGREPGYIGRPERASPAEGWSDVHTAEQRRIVEAVLGLAESAAQQREVASHAD